jgi:hypothetical protein
MQPSQRLIKAVLSAWTIGPDDLLTTREAARVLGLTEGHLKNLRANGSAEPAWEKHAGRVYYRGDTLAHYVAAYRILSWARNVRS